MGRSFRRIVPVAAVVFALLVVVPPPLAALPRPASRVGPGGYSIPLKNAAKIIGKLFELLKNLPREGSGNKLVENSADSVPLFVFNLTVGTSSPPQNISGFLDINNQLVWSQCSPCTACLPPPAPVFEPNRSSTFATLPCGSQTCQQAVLNETCSGNAAGDDRCKYEYTSDSINATGYLANDTFTFGATPVPGLVFGCSDAILQGNLSGGASGNFGLSRGPLSLVSQLQLSWFSYILPSDSDDDSSRIEFGGDVAPPQTKSSRSTPLLNSSLYPDQYSVKLTGVRVDGSDLAADIPAGTFDFRADGSGGVFLSTTYPLTVLEQAAYDAVRKAIAGSITAAQPVNGSAIGLDLCYKMEALQNVTVPKLALVFDGDDAVMNLKRHNYFFADNGTGLNCLTIIPYTGMSLLGSLVQTGTAMTYDIENARLIFDTTAAQTAAAASPAAHSLTTTMMMLLYHLAAWVVLF